MFEKEEQRSDELETSLKLADSWKRQGDELLYSMIPRPVAERLRSGKNDNDLLMRCDVMCAKFILFIFHDQDRIHFQLVKVLKKCLCCLRKSK